MRSFKLSILAIASCLLSSVAVAQVCSCGGCVDDTQGKLSILAQSKTVKYYIEPGKHMHGITVKQTRDLIRQAFREMSQPSGLKLVESPNKSGAFLRIEFHGNNSVMQSGTAVDEKTGKRVKVYALGKAWRSGRIALNTDRKIANLMSRRTMLTLCQHEAGHCFGWGHARMDQRNYVMHPWSVSDYFSPEEVRTMQKKWSKPTAGFYPIDRGIVGNQIRDQTAKAKNARDDWTRLKQQRTDIIARGDWRKNHPIQARILKLVDSIRAREKFIAELARKWHTINKKWKGVPYAK